MLKGLRLISSRLLIVDSCTAAHLSDGYYLVRYLIHSFIVVIVSHLLHVFLFIYFFLFAIRLPG
jgi:hypothetical protein